MSDVPRKVVIVRPDNNQPFETSSDPIDMLIRSVVVMIERNASTSDPISRAPAEVAVVASDALHLALVRGPEQLVLFMTRGEIELARKVKRQHPRHTIVVFSSDFPSDEVLLVPKQLIRGESLSVLVREL